MQWWHEKILDQVVLETARTHRPRKMIALGRGFRLGVAIDHMEEVQCERPFRYQMLP